MFVFNLFHVLALSTIAFNFPFSAGGSRPDWFFSNLIEEGSLREAECDSTILSVTHDETTSFGDPVPRLHGKWVSQSCEIRKGPRYIIRSLSFSGNLSFKFAIFYYDDVSCTSPIFSLSAEGQMTLHNPSWTASGAKQSKLTLNKLSAFKYSNSENATDQFNQLCPGLGRKRWKLHKEHNISDDNLKVCLMEELKELSLLKTQARMVNGRRINELLTKSDFSEHVNTVLDFRPLFNTPLISGGQRHGCSRCHSIAKSSGPSPPILMPIPQFPPLLIGEWVSQRCEALPLGVFLLRRLSFGPNPTTWVLEASYHSDSRCLNPTFTIFAKGKFKKGTSDDVSSLVNGAFDLDWTMLQAHVEIKDRSLREALQDGGCQKEKWNSKVAFGVPDPKCSLPSLSIAVPASSQSLVRLEIDPQGSPLMYLGEPTGAGRRSSSFLPALTQCSSMLPMSPQALTSSSGKITIDFSFVLVSIFVCILKNKLNP